MDFRFTTDPGSKLLYYGDEFVAKMSAKHAKHLEALIEGTAIELVRAPKAREDDAVEKHSRQIWEKLWNDFEKTKGEA